MQLNSALERVATIHQQHAIKCYLAVKSLKNMFNWPKEDWSTIENLIKIEEPKFDLKILQSNELPFEVIRRRRHWVLAHAIYPYAYFTMLDWFQESCSKKIFDYYLEQSTEKNEYLGHNVSILLAFIKAWDEVHTENQKLRFIERFCEFITATFYGNNHKSYPLHHDYKHLENFGINEVLKCALAQPGFWGHHIIALASITRAQSSLSETTFEKLLINLHEQCHWVYQDEMDQPHINELVEQVPSFKELECQCHKLLLNKKDNLHQITLAESIAYIFHRVDISQNNKLRLLEILKHYSKN